MEIFFVEFKLPSSNKKITVNVSKIVDFFETVEEGCTIVMGAEEVFQVDHKYEDVVNMVQAFSDSVKIARI